MFSERERKEPTRAHAKLVGAAHFVHISSVEYARALKKKMLSLHSFETNGFSCRVISVLHNFGATVVLYI